MISDRKISISLRQYERVHALGLRIADEEKGKLKTLLTDDGFMSRVDLHINNILFLISNQGGKK